MSARLCSPMLDAANRGNVRSVRRYATAWPMPTGVQPLPPVNLPGPTRYAAHLEFSIAAIRSMYRNIGWHHGAYRSPGTNLITERIPPYRQELQDRRSA